MKKKIACLISILFTLLHITACGIRGTKVIVPESKNPQNTFPTIICWGDSMTAGYGKSEAQIKKEEEILDVSNQSYPEILQILTGNRVLNFGVTGATSKEIVSLQKKVKANAEDILILEIGSNGGWDGDYQTLIAQYDTMIGRAESEHYIIIGDTDDPGTSLGDPNQQSTDENGHYIGTSDTMWEAALRQRYQEHFINMRVYMIENGLDTAGLTSTPEDEEAAKQGCISSQLRSDWTHFNSYGYYAQAVAVYEKGIELGYWK